MSNLIRNQAREFWDDNETQNYKILITDVRSHLYEYKKNSHKIEFLDELIIILKYEFDKHYINCTEKESGKCPINRFYENSLFFLQEEVEDLENNIDKNDFSKSERNEINLALNKILEELNLIKLGQELTYDDFASEFEEMKDLYFLNKKNWKQLMTGKLAEMIAGGIISESLSKEILNSININYSDLIK